MRLMLLLHVGAAVLFLGAMITSAYWKARADRSGSMEAMAYACRSLLFADVLFTGPGIIGLLATGFWMVNLSGWDRFQEPWLALSFLSLLVVAILWAAIMVPLQLRMVRLSRLQISNVNTDPEYRKSSRRWAIVGGIATLMTVGILFLMVMRPEIRAGF